MEANPTNITILGINCDAGIKLCGSMELYLDLLREVYGRIEPKCLEVEHALAAGDLRSYTTTVHALKTTCRMLGHGTLAEKFFVLETLGKEEAMEEAIRQTPAVLQEFRNLIPLLAPYIAKEPQVLVAYSREDILELLDEIIAATADFDIDRGEAAADKLLTYDCEEALGKQLKELSTLVANLDYSDASALASAIQSTL